jgi:hypothetical protein
MFCTKKEDLIWDFESENGLMIEYALFYPIFGKWHFHHNTLLLSSQID